MLKLRTILKAPRRPRPALTAADLAGCRAALLALADRLATHLARDSRELLRLEEPDVPTGPMSSTEDEPDAGRYEVDFGLIANESGMLGQVTAALARIDVGTFGVCERCRRGIARARLAAVPYALHCIRCARATADKPSRPGR
jgi:RNA polymerase-binding transcription factor DksA